MKTKVEEKPLPKTLDEAFLACDGEFIIRKRLEAQGIKLKYSVTRGWLLLGHIPFKWSHYIKRLIEENPNHKELAHLAMFFGSPKRAPKRKAKGDYPNQELFEYIMEPDSGARNQYDADRRKIGGVGAFSLWCSKRHGIHVTHHAIYSWMRQGYVSGPMRKILKGREKIADSILGEDPLALQVKKEVGLTPDQEDLL